MKIALLGYGKMGHEVERIAVENGHFITLVLDNEVDWVKNASKLKECDVAIEFSIPSTTISNIRRCFEAGIPVVVGTTGWYEQFQEAIDLCSIKNGTLFYATNFSIGVHVFCDINKRLAKLLESYPIYSPLMVETHHSQKLDKPSGTAITLAKDIISSNSRFERFTFDSPRPDEIQIQSIREGSVTGKHTITWESEIDTITITHEAKNRRGFALGAIMAAAWIQERKGVYTMKDMINV